MDRLQGRVLLDVDCEWRKSVDHEVVGAVDGRCCEGGSKGDIGGGGKVLGGMEESRAGG